jgi:hypothetical protein
VESGVSLLLTLLSSTLSAGVASPETPFSSISMGSTIAEAQAWIERQAEDRSEDFGVFVEESANWRRVEQVSITTNLVT